MNETKLILNVHCKCEKGHVVLESTYFENTTMTCTVCDIVEVVNCYYIDELLEEHRYNDSITDDINILNRHGKWELHHEKQFVKKSEVESMLNGYDLICEVDGWDVSRYYRKGLEFFMIKEYDVRFDQYKALKFVVNEDSIEKLIQYFIK